MTTITPTPIDRSSGFLSDYCPRCCPAGHHEPDRQTRMHALFEPDSVSWDGGRRVTTSYRCACCGHQWSRADLYDAASAGFGADRPYRRGAA